MPEQNEFVFNSQNPSTRFNVTDPMLLSLRQTKPWTMLVSIVGFIYVGFMVILGIGSMFMLSMFDRTNSVLSGMLGAVYIIMAVVYFFPTLFLFKFSSSLGRLIDGGGATEMEEALLNQKSFWKFIGILTVVGIVLSIIGIIAAIAIPLFFSMAR
jgi:hypothetical protein